MSAAGNAIQRIVDVAIGRLVALEPEVGLAAHALNVASVGAWHSGQAIAILPPLVRATMVNQVLGQLSAGITTTRRCDCPNCNPVGRKH